MRKRISYLAIAITTKCNYSCFYCKSTGESVMQNVYGELDFERIKTITRVAYKLGINTFRITGGEPTMVEYLPSLIRYLMEMAEDTKIRLNTNGYKLGEPQILDVIETFKERINVMISVDSLREYHNGMHYPKYLSKKVETLSRELVTRKIETRFNIVATKSNIKEIPELIDRALKLGVNVKVLDLIIRDNYIGNIKTLTGNKAIEFGKSEYASLDRIYEHLNKIADKSSEKYYVSNSFGIPSGGYFIGNQSVQVKNSSKGALYSKVCISSCPYYQKCREGLFSPFLSVGEILHLSGCMNKELYYNLANKSEHEIRGIFEQIITLFDDTELKKQ